jgi:hypothetical protein
MSAAILQTDDSIGRRASAFTLLDMVRPVCRHYRVTAGVFLASMANVLLAEFVWPLQSASARLIVLAAGVGCAIAAGATAAWLRERRNPCFRSRQEIERVLGTEVLASCRSEGHV